MTYIKNACEHCAHVCMCKWNWSEGTQDNVDCQYFIHDLHTDNSAVIAQLQEENKKLNDEKLELEKRYETARDLLDTASVVLHVYSHGSALSKQIREFLDK